MRRRNLFWGIVIILVGLFLLLNQILPWIHLDRFFWPIVLVLVGLWLLLNPLLFRRRAISEESLSIPLEGTPRADIRLRHGAGRMEIYALDSATDLLSGTFNGGVEQDVERRSDQVKVKLKTPSDIYPYPHMGSQGLAWRLGLNRNIPLELRIEGGASEMELNLTDLQVEALTIETGASSTRVNLPAHTGYTRVDVKAGAASVDLRVPEGVAGRITAKTGLSSVHIDTTRFPSNGPIYQSTDYETAANKVEITIEAGVGSFEVR